MTISTTSNHVSYIGNGVTSIFAFPYYFLLDTDLYILRTDGATGVVSLLALAYDYTVAGAGLLSGGTVTLLTPLTVNSTLSIARVEPITQLTDYVQDDPFPAASHEKALDKLTMICQQLQSSIDLIYAGGGGGGGGTAITMSASNIGTGLGVYKETAGSAFIFRTVKGVGVSGADVTTDGSTVTVNTKYLLALANSWVGGEQYLDYIATPGVTVGDAGGWTSLVHDSAGNTQNLVALTGHAYHDKTTSTPGSGAWGIATEAWSSPSGGRTLIGGEFSVIQQNPFTANPSIGVNAVFKNRSDVATHPTAAAGLTPLYNFNSTALFISSQQRPSGGGAAWNASGSGWQAAIRIGDYGFGSGLDWEAGSWYPAATSLYKAYTTIIDMTGALLDMAGGIPWQQLWRNGSTYFGTRFNPINTGGLQQQNLTVTAGGAGYVVGDSILIDGGFATFSVSFVAAGAVTGVILTQASFGYGVGVHTTTAITGVGAGCTLTLALATGSLFGGNLTVGAGGAGYAVNDFVQINGAGTDGRVFVTSVAAGVVTGIRLGNAWQGKNYVPAFGVATTAITGVGVGLTINIYDTYNETQLGGEKYEYWRMTNPADPIGTGSRHGYVDMAFPGVGRTINTAGATYTFANDGPL